MFEEKEAWLDFGINLKEFQEITDPPKKQVLNPEAKEFSPTLPKTEIMKGVKKERSSPTLHQTALGFDVQAIQKGVKKERASPTLPQTALGSDVQAILKGVKKERTSGRNEGDDYILMSKDMDQAANQALQDIRNATAKRVNLKIEPNKAESKAVEKLPTKMPLLGRNFGKIQGKPKSDLNNITASKVQIKGEPEEPKQIPTSGKTKEENSEIAEDVKRAIFHFSPIASRIVSRKPVVKLQKPLRVQTEVFPQKLAVPVSKQIHAEKQKVKKTPKSHKLAKQVEIPVSLPFDEPNRFACLPDNDAGNIFPQKKKARGFVPTCKGGAIPKTKKKQNHF